MEVQIAEVSNKFNAVSVSLVEVSQKHVVLKKKLKDVSKRPLPKLSYLVKQIDESVGMVEYHLKALEKNMVEIEDCIGIFKLVK